MSDESHKPEPASAEPQRIEPQPAAAGNPKRLPGLWVICVVFAHSGFFYLSRVALATPLGMAAFGALALGCFAAAVGLWLRWNVVRIVVMALLGLESLYLLVRLVTAIRGNASDAGLLFAGVFVPLLVSVLIVVHLWFRRAHFKLPWAQRPRLLSGPGIAAAVVVVVPGIALMLRETMDDAPQRFPRLEFAPQAVPDGQNAFVALEETLGHLPKTRDKELDRFLDPPPGEEDLLESAEGRAEAKEVLDRYQACFEGIDKMLGLPGFSPPSPATAWKWIGADRSWLSGTRHLARLLVFKSDYEIADGRWEDALRDADKAVRLGDLFLEQNDSTSTYMVGRWIAGLACDQIRKAAASPGATIVALASCIPEAELADPLKRGLHRALAQEFTRYVLLLREMQTSPAIAENLLEEPGGRELTWLQAKPASLYRAPMKAWLKVNLSRNQLGRRMDGVLDRLQRYQRPSPEPEIPGLWPFLRSRGIVGFLRNPVGEICVEVLAPIENYLIKGHFQMLANARLTQVFLALRCYQLESGRLPATLDELAPKYFAKVPVDPFTEKPFIYEPDATPPRLYSVGPDQKADAPDAEGRDDIVVELNFPPNGPEAHR